MFGPLNRVEDGLGGERYQLPSNIHYIDELEESAYDNLDIVMGNVRHREDDSAKNSAIM